MYNEIYLIFRQIDPTIHVGAATAILVTTLDELVLGFKLPSLYLIFRWFDVLRENIFIHDSDNDSHLYTGLRYLVIPIS
jgi:hypothetical protein